MGFRSTLLVLVLAMMGLAAPAKAALNCNVDAAGNPFPDVGDIAALLTQTTAATATGACASGGCDFDASGAATPTSTDLDALINVVLNTDPDSLCSVGILGTLEKTPDTTTSARAASQTFLSPTQVSVTAVDLLSGQTVSLRPVSPDGFGEFRVPLAPTSTPADVMLVITDGSNTLKAVAEAVSTQSKNVGTVDFGSTVAGEVYQYLKRDLGQTPVLATLKSQMKTAGYILDGASHTAPPTQAYLDQVKACMSGGGCALSDTQPKLAFQIMENNYIATYFFAFAYQMFNQYGPTTTAALGFGAGGAARHASVTCATGETQVTPNICFSFTTGLTMVDQPVDGTACLANGTLKPTLMNETVNGNSVLFSQWKGPITISKCATTDLLENGVVDIDLRYRTNSSNLSTQGISIQNIRNSSLVYQSSESSLRATLVIPAADGSVCIQLCPDTYDYARDASMVGTYTMTFNNTQAQLTAQGGFSYPAANNVLISGSLVGSTRDTSIVSIPFSVDASGSLTLTAEGSITLAGGAGTVAYSSAPGQFTFNTTTGGAVNFTGPQGTSGNIVYNINGSGSGGLILTGGNIGQLAWTSLTKRASLQFATGAALPSATMYVISK